MSFTVSKTIETQAVADLLCCAFEGGSNYWANVVLRHNPTTWEFLDDGEHKYIHTVPLNPGGFLIFQEPDGKQYSLDQGTIQKGLQIMAEKYPEHFADFVAENADADTGDVFLQCCLFGEVVYG
jgi:hypothetical protein